MHFGLKRSDSRTNGTAKQKSVRLMYYGYAAVNIRGPVTGQLYQFSRLQPVQSVNTGDAASILNTRLFRRTR